MLENYIVFHDSLSSNCLDLHDKPMFLENLFSTVLICSFREIFSSNITLKKNLPISSDSHKNDMPKVSHYSTV